MRRDDAGGAGLGEGDDGPADGLLPAEVERRGGFVEQQRPREGLREGGEGHREMRAFLLAAGQLGKPSFRESIQLELREMRGEPLRVADDRPEVGDAIIPGADGFLRAVGPGPGARRRVDEPRVVAADLELARAGREARERAQERRLAGAVGSDDRDDLAAFGGERDAVDEASAVDLDREAEGADHGLSHGPSWRSR